MYNFLGVTCRSRFEYDELKEAFYNFNKDCKCYDCEKIRDVGLAAEALQEALHRKRKTYRHDIFNDQFLDDDDDHYYDYEYYDHEEDYSFLSARDSKARETESGETLVDRLKKKMLNDKKVETKKNTYKNEIAETLVGQARMSVNKTK